MMQLPDDIIESLRDVYVLNYYEPNFDMSRWRCLGVFNSVLAAKKAASRIGLKSIDNFNLYDPAKRYYPRPNRCSDEGAKTWVDRWALEMGMSVYTIETHRLDSEDQPSETLHFNFDAYIKRHFVDSGLGSRDARELLVSWKRDPPFDILLGLFSTEEEMFRTLRQDPSREEWLEKHAYVAHYPYGGTYDPIRDIDAE
jgi:hypothetical protein